MASNTVAVSAPGKVLFSGGFLVLDRRYTGLVIGLDARIHVHIKRHTEDASTDNHIEVRSPQFEGAVWRYSYGVAPEGVADVRPLGANNTSNKFVETTLLYVLTYLHHLPSSQHAGDSLSLCPGLTITILADDDYYSTQSTMRVLGKFNRFNTSLSKAHKTGLGSSAALVTALTSALLCSFEPFLEAMSFADSYASNSLHKRIHNLAQAAHCAAQGKVGSGFDVAAAVHGSCLYRRFTPTILEHIGDSHLAGFGERLYRCVDDLDPDHAWDVEVLGHAVHIPETLRLLMCDVDCGSETPGMVKQVLKWRAENQEEADLLWDALQKGTEDLCAELKRLSTRTDTFTGLRDIILTNRSLVRDMSAKSRVPIEPKVQTELLNACSEIPGVIGGVCPGAGGYDAVALLIRNDDKVLAELKQKLSGWKGVTEEGSGATIGNVNLLNVKQDVMGLRVEDATKYHEWT